MEQSNRPSIWVPVLIFSNTPDNDFTIIDSKSSLTVTKLANYTKSPLYQLDEVAYYEGRENPITYRRKFKKLFSCHFQLYFYPFDTQVCLLSFLLSLQSIYILSYLYINVDMHYLATQTSTLGRLGQAVFRQGGIFVGDYFLIFSSLAGVQWACADAAVQHHQLGDEGGGGRDDNCV